MKKITTTALTLVAIIIAWALFIRYMNGSESLLEYAEKNPEIAYGTPEPPSISPGASPSAISSPFPANEPSPSDQQEPLPSETPGAEEGIHEDISPERVTYQPDFYYEPLSDELVDKITGISYPVTQDLADKTAVPAVNIVSDTLSLAVEYEDLRYLRVLHYDFTGEVQTGELICNKAIADDLVQIFHELYRNEYQIEKIRLIEEYNGDDTRSMEDNNTSCFNYRVVDGTDSLSKHAYGMAIDINPLYNPYVVFKKDGTTYVSPSGSEPYTDRSKEFPYKIYENDLCCKLFLERGFIWGGNWNSMKDYQHFQKNPVS